MYFSYTAQQILDKRKIKKIETVDRKEYASMCIPRMNSQVPQYDGFTPGQRDFGRSPKLQIGAADGPHFRDFTNLNVSFLTQTHGAIAKFREIRKTSL